MEWHEMQKLVCSDRCMWKFTPPAIASAGRTHSPRKATIFQPVPAVTVG